MVQGVQTKCWSFCVIVHMLRSAQTQKQAAGDHRLKARQENRLHAFHTERTHARTHAQIQPINC